MRTETKWTTVLVAGILAVGSVSGVQASSVRTQHKTKKLQLPALPTGPLGPMQALPLDSLQPVAPQVSFRDGQLTIVAPNSTLGDILRAVRKQTSAEIEIPAASERVVTRIGPGPAREVVAELLNGSRFNYVLLGSPSDANSLTRVVLVAKTGTDTPAANATGPNLTPEQMGANQAGNMAPPPPQDAANDAPDAEAAEENPPDEGDQNAAVEVDQPAGVPDPNGVRTPQQMLQEMQQRQLQMQQQLAPGQPPIPGAGIPGLPQRPPMQEP